MSTITKLRAATKSREGLAQPPAQYKVILINDDYTPMDFVILILQTFFDKPFEEAVSVMMQIHTQGKATAGIYTWDIATTKTEQVRTFAATHQHPLLCLTERV